MNSINLEISPGIIIFIAVIILVIVIIKADKTEKELRAYKYKEMQEREIYYKNRNYKAKDSSFYLMTPKQKLEYTYDRLPEKEQEKVRVYAENLLKQIENQKYETKR